MPKFTTEQDNLLIAIKTNHPYLLWSDISKINKKLSKLNSKQIYHRWKNYLNPQLNNSKWSQEEIDKLIKLQEIFGNIW